MKKSLLIFALTLASYGIIQAQVTTSSVQGVVTQSAGTVTPGATITATHVPSGTAYRSSTNETGRFNMANMRVGGPYRIEVTFVGQEPVVYQDIYLQLGQPFVVNPVLGDNSTALEEVVVLANGARDTRTGASTTVSKQQLENMPTLNRSLQDFTRLTPQANGNSFGGINNRYNNITIDGAVNNDVFGLSGSGTPGGQANTQPISLDAIQEIQVVLAPYDVTQGNFTGGGVNAVTRSGTNNVEGSVYFFGRNQNTIGKDVLSDIKADNFNDNQFGFRLGGPIVKDKLFFFVNGEMGRRTAPLLNNAGEVGSAISLETAERIANHTLSTYGYDVGSYEAMDVQTQNNKVFAKLDWNISTRHQLSARYNFIDAFDDNISRSASAFRFGNNAYQFKNKQHGLVAELRSNFSNAFSNNLIVGYTSIRDNRGVAGGLFPQVTIRNIDGVSGSSVDLGSQRSSTANELDQDIFEFTNNFKWNVGKHIFTFGTHNEFFKFRNLFINNANGYWQFASVDDYINNNPSQVEATYSLIEGDNQPAAKFSAAQLAFYAQGESEFLENLKLTYGIRLDVPIIGDTPGRNEKIEASFPGYRTDRTPSGKVLFSPRFGFNYDPMGDRSVVVRGGAGIFTGRVPFVWLSNQFSNDGVMFGSVFANQASQINDGNGFDPNIDNQRNMGPGSTRAEVNLVSEDFKIPQVARFNLAGDFKLPYNIVATVEGIYSKTINNIIYSDINISGADGTISSDLTNGADLRPSYAGQRVNSDDFTSVILIDNTNKGYTYSLTGQLQKNFYNGFNAMVAYTYGRARSVNDGSSSTARSNWQFVQMVENPNLPPLANSTFDMRHRIVGSTGYTVNYGRDKIFATSINIFYAGRSGSPFTYLYGGDLNGDGGNGNDLLYIPNNANEINLVNIESGGQVVSTPAQQWDALNAYIDQDPYLSKMRGKYVERNGANLPWQHQFDLRIAQDIGGIFKGTKNRIQLTFDIFNVGNLLNNDWGRSYFVNNDAYELIGFRNGGYTFTAPRDNQPYTVSALASRWQGQFGVRYIFN